MNPINLSARVAALANRAKLATTPGPVKPTSIQTSMSNFLNLYEERSLPDFPFVDDAVRFDGRDRTSSLPPRHVAATTNSYCFTESQTTMTQASASLFSQSNYKLPNVPTVPTTNVITSNFYQDYGIGDFERTTYNQNVLIDNVNNNPHNFYSSSLCANSYPIMSTAVRNPARHQNNNFGVGPTNAPVYLKADEKNAILEMLPSVNSNNLRCSLKQFELAIEMYGVNEDRDRRELALRYFPKFIADVFFENAGSSSGYAELREIIVENSQQLYSCHNIAPCEIRTWDPFSVFRKADHMLACPREEWQKEIITQLSPPVIQKELRLIMDLNLVDFKNRYQAIFKCFKINKTYGPSRQNTLNFTENIQQTTNRPSTLFQTKKSRPASQQQVCFFHRKYGRDAYSCSGGNCAMHPPTGVRPVNQGNYTGGRYVVDLPATHTEGLQR